MRARPQKGLDAGSREDRAQPEPGWKQAFRAQREAESPSLPFELP